MHDLLMNVDAHSRVESAIASATATRLAKQARRRPSPTDAVPLLVRQYVRVRSVAARHFR